MNMYFKNVLLLLKILAESLYRLVVAAFNNLGFKFLLKKFPASNPARGGSHKAQFGENL